MNHWNTAEHEYICVDICGKLKYTGTKCDCGHFSWLWFFVLGSMCRIWLLDLFFFITWIYLCYGAICPSVVVVVLCYLCYVWSRSGFGMVFNAITAVYFWLLFHSYNNDDAVAAGWTNDGAYFLYILAHICIWNLAFISFNYLLRVNTKWSFKLGSNYHWQRPLTRVRLDTRRAWESLAATRWS